MYKSGKDNNLLKGFALSLIFFLFFSFVYAQDEVVNSIDINGNQVFNDSRLKDRLKLKKESSFYSTLFFSDIDSLRQFYNDEGYPHAKISASYSIENNRVTIQIDIYEGDPVKIKDIKIKDEKFNLKRILKKYKNKIYSKNNKSSLISDIRDFLANKGYFKPDIKLEKTRKNGVDIYLSIVINEGDIHYYGDIMFTGLNSIKEEYLKRRLDFSTGDRYSKEEVIEYRKLLYDLNVFKNIDIKYFERKNKYVDLLFDITEDKNKWIGFNVGYTTPAITRIGFEWGNNNFLRKLLVLKFSNNNNIDFNKNYYEVTADINLTQPRFFVNRFSWENSLNLKLEKDKKSKYNKLTYSSLFTKEFRKDYFFLFGFEKKLTFYEDLKIEESETQKNKWLVSNNIVARFYYDNIDRKINPVNDSFYISLFERLSGYFLKGDWQFLYGNYEAAFYKNIYKSKLISLLHLNFKIYSSINNELNVPYDELISLGGVYDIRGYSYKGIGEEFYKAVIVNIAQRLKIYKSFWLEGFVDIGEGMKKNKNFRKENLKITTGIELRYVLPFLVLRTGYAYKISEEGENFYLTIGQIF